MVKSLFEICRNVAKKKKLQKLRSPPFFLFKFCSQEMYGSSKSLKFAAVKKKMKGEKVR